MKYYIPFLFLLFSSNMFAQSTGLDISFSTKGVFKNNAHVTPAQTLMWLQADNKILLAHTEVNSQTYKNQIVVTRLLPNGLPDISFAKNGSFNVTYNSYEEAIGIRTLNNGKIVLAIAPLTYQDNQYSIIRLTPEGKMDSTFSDSGVVHRQFAGIITLNSLAIQNDGKILLAGGILSQSTLYYYIIRHNEDGTLDYPFGTNGTLQLPILQPGLHAYNLAVQPDNKILVAGTSVIQQSTQKRQITIARCDQNGLDGGFGNGLGHTSFSRPVLYRMSLSDMLLQPNGDILLTGTISYGYEKGNYDWVAKIKRDGNIDSSFGNDGYVELDSLEATYTVYPKLAMQQDGRILVSYGEAGTRGLLKHTMRRLLPNGENDPGFYYNGRLSTAIIPDKNYASDIKVQTDGKILLAGRHFNSTKTQGMYVSRYMPNETLNIKEKSEDAFSVFPNPVQSRLYITGISEDATIEIIDLTGRKLYKNSSVNEDLTIDMTKFSTGQYLLKMTNPEGNSRVTNVIKL